MYFMSYRRADVAEAKKLVSEEELVQQMEEFEEKNGGPVNLFRRIAKVSSLAH